MMNGYEFLKYKPETCKQFSCKGITFVYDDGLQAVKRVDIFTHYNIIAFIVNGEKIIHCPGKSWLLTAGNCYFFKKGAYNQALYLHEGWRSMNIYIPDAYLRELIGDYLRCGKVQTMGGHAIDQVIQLDINEISGGGQELMFSAFSGKPIPAEDVLEQQFRQLIFSIFGNRKNQQLVSYLKKLAEQHKTSLFEVMEANYMYNLSLTEYARIANRSLATFKREFRRLFYTTPAKWLMDRRLDFAQLMLDTTGKNIGQIMSESGFENSSHFSRVFKEKFGASPLNYRKEKTH
ncbi:AraC family transcriptional regulator [Dyadobacter sp. LHD-138]|uniref:AraC family transcriptional regulator n=1 Tax=Dyadobacter sp. LHD-138 TaxID=3071413 RepID=UPI0027E06D40|nr:AraC family transcriptional regulator [Dyadobacter sp. LHD-138]MDQ6481128.1 AraC family transcriptional regulator [Dyadobacter sp. LHD-138]